MMAAPTKSTAYEFEWGPSPFPSRYFTSTTSRTSTEFSPPLIAMVAVIAIAALIVLLRRLPARFRRWRRRRNILSASFSSDPFDSPPVAFSSPDHYFFSPYYGLDELSIKSLPLSRYSKSRSKLREDSGRECAVCLIEFTDGDHLRSLPFCSHAFHVDCIDIWLRSHATCPLCRSGVLVPVPAARIRPSFDDLILELPLPSDPEISAASPPPRRDFLLKRSYSLGFERNFAADSSMASPWRYRQQRGFWSKRWPSPFGASGGSRVFSFRSYRGGGGVSAGKSPFGKRRGFFPLSNGGGGVGSSWRRNRAMTSPSAVFMRSVMGVGPAVTGFSSSRMRCGDPEALLSPERLGGPR